MAAPRRGYYSIIQYRPDAGRMESVNLGVVLIITKPVDYLVQMRPDNDRVLRFFPRTDSRMIDDLKANITERLDTAYLAYRGHHDFVAKMLFANQLQMTELRPMTIRKSTIDELQRLYDELVAEENQ